jgi:sterol desaturase/sphingolipid hydroxylase (fatty acid hydroxylase superfamily)
MKTLFWRIKQMSKIKNGNRTDNLIVIIGTVLGAITVIAAVGAVIAWIVMMLWNSVIVYLFGAPELTFWLSWGLIILLKILSSFFRSVTNKGD